MAVGFGKLISIFTNWKPVANGRIISGCHMGTWIFSNLFAQMLSLPLYIKTFYYNYLYCPPQLKQTELFVERLNEESWWLQFMFGESKEIWHPHYFNYVPGSTACQERVRSAALIKGWQESSDLIHNPRAVGWQSWKDLRDHLFKSFHFRNPKPGEGRWLSQDHTAITEI